MKKKTNGLLTQSSFFGRKLGNITTIAQQSNIYIQMAILAFSSIGAYGVFQEGLSDKGYNIPFWVFALVLIIGLAIMFLFVWKFAMHSTFATWNTQWWSHKNPLRARLDKREKLEDERYEELKKMIQDLKK